MNIARLGAQMSWCVVLTLAFILAAGSALTPGVAMAATTMPTWESTGYDDYNDSVYYVRPGDTLDSIAARHHTTTEALMWANGIKNPNRIYVGQALTVPASGKMGMQYDTCASYHVVRYGESLSGIALYYGLSSYELAQANGVYNLNQIFVGQHLCIPGKGHMVGGVGGPDYGYYDAYGPQNDGGKPVMKPEPEMKPKDDDRMYREPEPQKPAVKPDYSDDKPMKPKADEPVHKPDPKPQDKDQRPDPDRDGPSQGPPEKRDDKDRPDMDKPVGHDAGPRPTEFWKGSYFADKWLGEFAFDRHDTEVNFNWGTDNPTGLPADRFSVRWEKYEFFKEGDYRFTAVADDGVRVLVDGQVIIDGWKIQPATEYKADVHLSEGVHYLVVEYYEEAEDAQIQVNWVEKRPQHNYQPDWP